MDRYESVRSGSSPPKDGEYLRPDHIMMLMGLELNHRMGCHSYNTIYRSVMDFQGEEIFRRFQPPTQDLRVLKKSEQPGFYYLDPLRGAQWKPIGSVE